MNSNNSIYIFRERHSQVFSQRFHAHPWFRRAVGKFLKENARNKRLSYARMMKKVKSSVKVAGFVAVLKFEVVMINFPSPKEIQGEERDPTELESTHYREIQNALWSQQGY